MNEPRPHDRSRRRRRADDGEARSGAMQIVEAAIASILDVGYYRSSTNEIARRANVSWGAVQYHFGTREALLLGVVREIDRRFVAALAGADVVGDTRDERIASLYQLLASHYDTPAFLVRLQILLDLQHDPDTSDDVAASLREVATKSEVMVRRLLHQAIGADASRAETEALFHSVRGFAVSRQISRLLGSPPGRRADQEFLRGLALAYNP